MISDNTDNIKIRYGVAVGLFKDKEVLLSRRIDTPLFSKKWQFVNGNVKFEEDSKDSAVRLVEDQTGIKIDKTQLYYSHTITIGETKEFYYIYLVHLKDTDIPSNTDTKYRSDWKIFSLKNAVVLDLVPGIRPILRKLLRCLIKVELENLAKINNQDDRIRNLRVEADAIYDDQIRREIMAEEEELVRQQDGESQEYPNSKYYQSEFGC